MPSLEPAVSATFFEQEFAARHEALRTRLEKEALDVFVAGSPSSIAYLSGFRSRSPFQGSAAVVVPSRTGAVVIPPALEKEALAQVPDSVSVRTWSDEQGLTGVLVDVLREALPRRPIRLGIEEDALSYGQATLLTQAFGDEALVPAGSLVKRAREVKSLSEAASARDAAARLSSICDRAFRSSFEGRAELDLQLEIERELRLAGASSWSVTVLGGPNSARPRGHSSSRTFHRGDAVLIDIAATFGGLWADITRCGSIGGHVAKVERIWEKLAAAQRAAITSAWAGVPVCAVDRAAREALAAEGLAKFFAHRTGHGIGFDVIESPSVSAENAASLREGMMFTVEPGVYLPGEFGLRIEDTLILTEWGPEVLTATPRELRLIS